MKFMLALLAVLGMALAEDLILNNQIIIITDPAQPDGGASKLTPEQRDENLKKNENKTLEWRQDQIASCADNVTTQGSDNTTQDSASVRVSLDDLKDCIPKYKKLQAKLEKMWGKTGIVDIFMDGKYSVGALTTMIEDKKAKRFFRQLPSLIAKNSRVSKAMQKKFMKKASKKFKACKDKKTKEEKKECFAEIKKQAGPRFGKNMKRMAKKMKWLKNKQKKYKMRKAKKDDSEEKEGGDDKKRKGGRKEGRGGRGRGGRGRNN